MAVSTWERKELLLQVKDVSLKLSGRQILRDISAEVHNIVSPDTTLGQVVGILGPSGIGKTQFFRILSGLEDRFTGQVLVNSTQEPVRAGMVGVVPQDYRLFPHRTVLGNLLVAARHYQKADAHQRAMAMLERFKLADHAGHYPAELSGGQRQRVAIARQMLSSEHFLLMDEPFSGLDPLMLDEVSRLIQEVANMNELNTIFVVTHDIAAAVAIADTLWLMGRDRDDKGEIIPGARIQTIYDLAAMGLAWHPEIHETPQFAEFVHEVRGQFPKL